MKPFNLAIILCSAQILVSAQNPTTVTVRSTDPLRSTCANGDVPCRDWVRFRLAQQQTLSVRISESFRARLERARKPASGGRIQQRAAPASTLVLFASRDARRANSGYSRTGGAC